MTRVRSGAPHSYCTALIRGAPRDWFNENQGYRPIVVMLLAAHLSAPTLRAGTIACAPWRSNRMVIFRLDKTRVGAEIAAWRPLFCCKSTTPKVLAGAKPHATRQIEESFLTSTSMQAVVCTASGCAAGVMPLQSTDANIRGDFAPG